MGITEGNLLAGVLWRKHAGFSIQDLSLGFSYLGIQEYSGDNSSDHEDDADRGPNPDTHGCQAADHRSHESTDANQQIANESVAMI